MKLTTLLLLVSGTGLFAAEEAKPAAPTAAPAATTPATTAPATTAPTAEVPKSKVPGVSDEDYQKYISARNEIESNDPEVKAAKAKVDAAKAKAKSASEEDKAAADKESKDAEKAFINTRTAAVIKKYPELKDSVKKIGDFWNKEMAAKKKKKAAEAAPAASPETK